MRSAARSIARRMSGPQGHTLTTARDVIAIVLLFSLSSSSRISTSGTGATW